MDCEQEKIDLVIEFVTPIATLAINMPYVIRSRFIYSIAHLCHQANKAKGGEWKDDISPNDEIIFQTADKYGSKWRKYTALKCTLEKISNKKYAEQVVDFRNSYNHRYSPRIEFGLTNFVTRIVRDDGTVSYNYINTPPLKLADLIPSLKNQFFLLIDAFDKYKTLVREQILEIDNNNR